MPKNYNSYQKLFLDKKEGVYYDVKPTEAIGMQDPYNPWSYRTYVETECKIPSNKHFAIMENYDNMLYRK
jgi:hypothetical protein